MVAFILGIWKSLCWIGEDNSRGSDFTGLARWWEHDKYSSFHTVCKRMGRQKDSCAQTWPESEHFVLKKEKTGICSPLWPRTDVLYGSPNDWNVPIWGHLMWTVALLTLCTIPAGHLERLSYPMVKRQFHLIWRFKSILPVVNVDESGISIKETLMQTSNYKHLRQFQVLKLSFVGNRRRRTVPKTYKSNVRSVQNHL